jgi:hypothetical protein
MKVKCELCGKEIVSYEVEKERALKEVDFKIAQHFARRTKNELNDRENREKVHAKLSQEIQRAMELIAIWMVSTELDLGDEEDERQKLIHDKVNEGFDELIEILGLSDEEGDRDEIGEDLGKEILAIERPKEV